jgi:YD repeat-containing protein
MKWPSLLLALLRQGDAAVTISYQADERDVPGRPDGVIVQVDESTGAESATYFDRIGRVVEKAHKGFDTQWIHERVWFDGLGHVGAVYRPGVGAPTKDRTTYQYDSLDRIVEVVAPDKARTRYIHEPFRTEMSDPNDNYSTIDLDRDGRVVERMERVGADDVRTTYAYGPFNRVETVTDDVGNMTQIGYDKLGRRTLLDDPDKGLTLFGYDGFGDLAVETDALGDTIYTRDVLGRVTGKTDNDGFTEFVWDQGTQALGKLSQATSPDNTVVSHVYDAYGRPIETAWNIAGDTYSIKTYYDALGRQEELYYPEVPGRDRFAARYGYNAAGYLSQVEDIAWAGAEPRILWAVESRSVDDLVERSSVGTGVISTERMYDPVTGRLDFR